MFAEKEAITIIMAEDDDGHATLVERNLSKSANLKQFIRVKDGQDVLDLLANSEENNDGLLNEPLLLLLDLNMERLGGIETLKKIKANPKHSKIPTIMLTTSDNPKEISVCYELGCSVYVTKPIIYESFVEAIQQLGHFLELIKFPLGK